MGAGYTFAMLEISPSQRRDLRARAHHLHPVVAIGQHGLTAAVLHEIDVALKAHELIKVRVLGDDREQRDALATRICADLECAPVQHLGKVLILWRPRPDEGAEPPKARPRPVAKKPAARRQDATAPPAGNRSRRRRSTSAVSPAGVPRAAMARRRRRSA
jgi:RNA-binding protein